jgi:hypothetical protein
MRGDVDGHALLKNLNGKPNTPVSSPKKAKSFDAQNLFSHLRDISEKVEKEDERDRRRSRSDRNRSHSRRRHSRRRSHSRSYRDHHRSHESYADTDKKDAEEKALLLQTYHLLRAQGVNSEMKLDFTADMLIMKTEVIRMQTELNSQKCIKFARKFLIALVSGIEFLNGKYNPLGLHLSGWSEHVMTTLGDYDSCFMRLYDKYKDKATVLSPEAELLLLLGGSGVMFHLTQAFINQNVPKFQDVAKDSPELAEKIAGIMAAKYKQRPPEDSDTDDDDTESVAAETAHRMAAQIPSRPFPTSMPPPKIPTELLSTPAFPAIIGQMIAPRPKYNPQRAKSNLETIREFREIDVDAKTAPKVIAPPIKESSEYVLVIP